MYNHAPKEYQCPICLGISGIESPATMMKQDDFFYRDNLVSALINSKFVGKNPGHVIIVPNEHFENIYDLPNLVGNRIFQLSKFVAIALKIVRNCQGVFLMQNNEPASEQHAFHYHLHIFPRFENDDLHKELENARVSLPRERTEFAKNLKKYFQKNPVKFDN